MSGTKNPFDEAIQQMAASNDPSEVLAIYHATVLAGLDTLTTRMAVILYQLDRIETYLQGKEPIEREEVEPE